MSEFKTNKISPRKGTTTTIGDSGDTIATSSGTTLDIQGTYSGINAISWDTTAKTADFTAETNKGYFIDTSSGGVTITLPATPVAGSFIGIKDYALTADTNAITIARNGNNIQGTASDVLIQTEGGVANLVYVDATQGWLTFDAAQASDIAGVVGYVTATGGTITTCGDYKIHTFTGPGTFCVSCAGTPLGNNRVDYLVVAGGGGGGGNAGGGGGAGGFRESKTSAVSGCWTASPLVSTCTITVTAQGYPISVGGGGAGCSSGVGTNGSNSIFSTITSTGGGYGGLVGTAGSGGSGGGLRRNTPCGGVGNTPPVSPPQGNNGGISPANSGAGSSGGGGGGATAVGVNGAFCNAGNGGAGATTSINATPTAYSGGGGGGMYQPCGTGGTLGSGGIGGGGDGSRGSPDGIAGTANTGGGGGGGGLQNTGSPNVGCGGAGGSGIVIIRYKYQ